MRSPLLTSSSLNLDLGLLLLRLFAGGVMLTHGLPKLQMVLSGTFKFGDPIGIGPEASLILVTFAEVVCAILLILGLFTKLATVPLIIDMAVAFFIAHAADEFGMKEMPLLYLGMYLVLFFTGPGRYSLDRGIFHERTRF